MKKITQEQIDLNVCKIQQLLQTEESGVWDEPTKSAMKNFQLRMGIPGTGDKDVTSITKLLERTNETLLDEETPAADLDIEATSDLSEKPNINIIEKYLSPDEYSKDNLKYEYIFLHHTAGGFNPYATVKDWEDDARGKIGTQYVIGGMDLKSGSDMDGSIIKCIPDGSWASHLGSFKQHGINFTMHKNSIGIELCNFGYLIPKNNKFYTYTNQEVPKNQVTDLGYTFRGYQYWHSYTNNQIDSLYNLLIMIKRKYNIDLKCGLFTWISDAISIGKHSSVAFQYSADATAGKVKGILSHTNVRKDKTDVYPHPNLVLMLKSL